MTGTFEPVDGSYPPDKIADDYVRWHKFWLAWQVGDKDEPGRLVDTKEKALRIAEREYGFF
jgi:hypothetical protein